MGGQFAPVGRCDVDPSAPIVAWFSTRRPPDDGSTSFALAFVDVNFLWLLVPLLLLLLVVSRLVLALTVGESLVRFGFSEVKPSVGGRKDG